MIETALTLNGKKRRLKTHDFLAMAANAGIPEKAALNMINMICGRREQLLLMCRQSKLREEAISAFSELINERTDRLMSGN